MNTLVKYFILIACILSFTSFASPFTTVLAKHNPKAVGVDFIGKQKPSSQNVKRTKANKANAVKKHNRTRPNRRFRR